MGFVTDYQAIPDGCELLERAKRDADFGEFLSPITYRFERGENCVDPYLKGTDAEFCAELQKLLRAHPGLETRNCSLVSYFDVIEYLISPARRDRKCKELDLGGQTIQGTIELAAHLRASQGILLRYNEPVAVLVMADLLTSITHDDLRRNYDSARMQFAAVYKFKEDRAGEEELALICELFDEFTKFYQSAAEHQEGVLVTMD